jgi:hypothetical protein
MVIEKLIYCLKRQSKRFISYDSLNDDLPKNLWKNKQIKEGGSNRTHGY